MSQFSRTFITNYPVFFSHLPDLDYSHKPCAQKIFRFPGPFPNVVTDPVVGVGL